MKKILAIILTAAMVVSISACGKKNSTDADSEKVEGKVASEAVQENPNLQSSGSIDNVEVSIDSAKVIDTEDGKAIMVTFTLNNTTSEEQNFNGVFSADALQAGRELQGANVVPQADGIDFASAQTMIAPGKSGQVQKFYMLNDEETDVEVLVTRAFAPEMGSVTKTFTIQ